MKRLLPLLLLLCAAPSSKKAGKGPADGIDEAGRKGDERKAVCLSQHRI